MATGRTFVGVDPAAASIEVARSGADDEHVTRVLGDGGRRFRLGDLTLPLVTCTLSYRFGRGEGWSS